MDNVSKSITVVAIVGFFFLVIAVFDRVWGQTTPLKGVGLLIFFIVAIALTGFFAWCALSPSAKTEAKKADTAKH